MIWSRAKRPFLRVSVGEEPARVVEHLAHLGAAASHLGPGRINVPRHHDDPFDRMLIAQAFARGLTVVTHDKRFTDYHLPTLPT